MMANVVSKSRSLEIENKNHKAFSYISIVGEKNGSWNLPLVVAFVVVTIVIMHPHGFTKFFSYCFFFFSDGLGQVKTLAPSLSPYNLEKKQLFFFLKKNTSLFESHDLIYNNFKIYLVYSWRWELCVFLAF